MLKIQVTNKFNLSSMMLLVSFVITLLATTKSCPFALAESQHNQQNNDAIIRERVDKFSSPSGDVYWRSSMQNPQIIDYLDQESIASLLDPQLGIGRPEAALYENSAIANLIGQQQQQQQQAQQQQQTAMTLPMVGATNGGFGTRNYHSLINDFKQNYLLSNPMREGRAFKPKLMSTARGFGKRSGNKIVSQQRIFGNYLY